MNGRRSATGSPASHCAPADRGVVLPALGMAIGFGLLGWVLAGELTRSLWQHTHTGANGTHYHHVDGHADTIVGLALAMLVAAVAGLLTLTITRGYDAGSTTPRSGGRVGRGGKGVAWSTLAPAGAFLLLQAQALGEAAAIPAVMVGAAIHAATGAASLMVARGCSRHVLQRFAAPALCPTQAPAFEHRCALPLDLATSRPVRVSAGTRAPPCLPAL